MRAFPVMFLFACSGSPSQPPPELVWTPCATITGNTDVTASCGEAQVPVRWDDPDGPRIALFVKRVGNGDAPTQLWMLNGGPGSSGADFDPFAEQLARDGSFVFYLPDHRGTGRSTRLGCAAEHDASPGGFAIVPDEWPACTDELVATHGEQLAGFTTTQAAHDLAWLIDETHRDGQAVNVWGGSYGTRWAQRYLQLRPDQATSITMMGVVPADRHMADYDQTYDDVARAFLERCSTDAYCRSRLGADAPVRARQIWTMLEGGHCAAAGLDRAVLRSFFAALLLSAWHERALIPATLFRLERCNPTDVAALHYLRAILAQPATPRIADRLQSSVLGTHISVNEFWPDDAPSLADLRAIDERAIVSFGSAPRLAERIATWPRYPRDEHAGGYPDTALPTLIINGEFDPATTLAGARDVASHFTQPHQSLVVGPDATHAFASPTTAGYACFIALVVAFARAPTSPLPACTTIMLPMDFRGAQVAAYFGGTDLWDGGPSFAPVEEPPLADELRRRIAAMR